MDVVVVGDTHLGHNYLFELGTRPQNFTPLMLKNMKGVWADSYLIHLGDFCIGRPEYWHQEWDKATGHIKNRVLVRGNHDKNSLTWYLNHGWSAVVDSLGLDVLGYSIAFTHRPIAKAGKAFTLNIHGHHHGNYHHERPEFYDKSFNLEYAPELFAYQPLTLTQKSLKRLGVLPLDAH